MSDIRSTEFVRLLKLSFDVCSGVVRFYTNMKFIIPDYQNFDNFLESNKHLFYHKQTPFVCCCQCVAMGEIRTSQREMGNWMFKKLYQNVPGIPCRVSPINGRRITICLCCIQVKTQVSLKELDINIISFLLRHTGIQNCDIENINKQRGILCHAWSTNCFSRNKYEGIWNILEQSTLALAKDVDTSYYEAIKCHIKTVKESDIDKDEAVELSNSIDEIAKTIKELKKEMDSIQTAETLSMVIQIESKDIQNSITKAESTVMTSFSEATTKFQENVKESTEEIKKEIVKGKEDGGANLRNVVSASENRLCDIIKTERDNLVTCVTHQIIKAEENCGKFLNDERRKNDRKMSKQIGALEQTMSRQYKDIKKKLVKYTEKMDNFISEVRMLVKEKGDDGTEINDTRKLDIDTKVVSDDLNEEKLVRNLTEKISKEETKQNDTSKFQICSTEQKCIELKLSAYPDAFESPDTLRSAVRDLIQQLLEAGEVDINKPGTMYLDFTVNTPLTKEEQEVVQNVFMEPCSSQKQFDAAEIKSKQADTHDFMDVDTTDIRGTAIKQKILERTEAMFYAQFGEIKTISEIRRHFQSRQTTPQEDMDSKRKMYQVVLEIKTPSSWSKDNINEKLEERLKKKEEHIEDDIELVKFEFKRLLLTTRVSEKLINDKQALEAAIGAFLKSIFDDCGIDTSIPETVFIIIDIYCPLKSEEQDVAIKDYAGSYSSQKQFNAVVAKSKKADTHDVMDVDTTDFRENILIKVENIQFNLTLKGLPYDFENDDTTSVNKETGYSFLGWTWDCPKHWDLSKIVSVVNDTLCGTTDWFQIDFVHIGASGKLEMQTCTQEHVFNSLLGLKSAVDTFLGKIVEACNLKADYAESVSINVVYLSGIMRDIEELKDEHRLISVDTKSDDIKRIMVECKSCGDKFVCENCETYLNMILHQSRMIENSDNDAEKEWETSSVDCQEPELKKRKTYTEDLTGDHQSEKVTTDLTSTEDSEMSFDINETLKKLGKLTLVDFKINEGEKQRKKLKRERQSFLNYLEGPMWYKHVVDILEDLKMRWKCRFSVSDNVLEELSYQRKQNAAGTEDLDFLDMNFGLQCNSCKTQNKEDISGTCKTCFEILCTKCLVQHHLAHSNHSYGYAEDILHGYTKTIDSFLRRNVVADIKCLTIDTYVIVHMDRDNKPLKLSIYDLTRNHLTTKLTSYGDMSGARIAVIDHTTMAVSIPPDAVLIVNYIDTIINTKEIKTSPGMTGGIASINNILYLAYKTGIKVFTLTGEELTFIDIPDITLLYTVSNCRLLCVYNRKCGQSKTMGYIDIMNNSLLPLEKLPFHPSSVAVDNEGNILFVTDNVVWQAKSDGSDCKVIISKNRETYKRVCFNAHSNSLIVAGSYYRGISVFRKVGDE